MGLAKTIFSAATGGGFTGAGGSGGSSQSSTRGRSGVSSSGGANLIGESVEGATGWVREVNLPAGGESTVRTAVGGAAAGGVFAIVVAIFRRK